MGERTPVATSTRRRPAAWRSARRSPTSPPPTSESSATSSSPPTGWPPVTAARTRALFETVEAVSEFCPAPACDPGRQGLAVDAHRLADDGDQAGGRAAVADRHRLRPVETGPQHAHAATAVRRRGTELLLIDLGNGANRLGGSAFWRRPGRVGRRAFAPGCRRRAAAAFFETVPRLRRDGDLLAYHDRADGGLFATLCEMAFAAKWACR